ncbi:site-2 protease family protein [Ruminiclostridium herbifermentans]|uniref:Site-2 protease family protein n=1 Tax=Ruminiclostridium herbifermentans TaxID=2488810 RepID=A0A4U7JII9_9FIRM|nr:site-2 protease family protein [Ruminiclostridium herbifermentans]QNU65332.1 site-2 protease family protein [Ruminiclostridium herbifermentans]
MFGRDIFSPEGLMNILMTLPGILLGFVLHEFAHAIVADKLGDPTPRSQGRITLDPRVHIDIVGFILILIAGFGWAKPVMTNPRNYKNLRRDSILVSIAGPLTNLLLASAFIFLMKIFNYSNAFSANEQLQDIIGNMLLFSAYINVVLFSLNILPLPALDGYHVITNLFNTWKYRIFNILEQYGMFIFILLAITGILGKILNPIISFVFNILIRLFL